ncbi:MAG: RES family NAD+ phosphorylase [Sumerlaeia bacterium]
MTRVAWRIVKEKYAAAAFDGEGAMRYGGRWNSRGSRVIYTSGSLALAALETLVHLNPPVAFRYVRFRVEFPDKLLTEIATGDLPADWRIEPPGPATQTLGDHWIRDGRSAVLAVPSTIVPEEVNYLLNPAHGDFGRIAIGEAQTFAFDPRLTRAKT